MRLSLCLCHRSLTALGPAKFMGLVVGRLMVKSVGPSNSGGPAVDGEATDGDGDENGFRGLGRHLSLISEENYPPYKTGTKTDA